MTLSVLPPTTVHFNGIDEISTTEVLEELGISYDTLHSRIRYCGFPKPVSAGRNGKQALYDRREVEKWILARGLPLKRSP